MAGPWSLPKPLLSRSVPQARAVPLVVGLRREDPTRIWERRSPLTPDAVRRLVSERQVRVHVEHCDRRVFRDHEYSQVRPRRRFYTGSLYPGLDAVSSVPY